MTTLRTNSGKRLDKRQASLVNLPRILLRPLPLFIIQPILSRIVRRVVGRRPELFRRLGKHQHTLYLIDPLNLPFALLLRPDSRSPSLKAVRRSNCPSYDARIAGTFLTLLDMVDGRLDGDALFFSRDLIVEGDTEAIVVLRNALDDMEGSIADDVALFYGPLGQTALTKFRQTRKYNYEQRINASS